LIYNLDIFTCLDLVAFYSYIYNSFVLCLKLTEMVRVKSSGLLSEESKLADNV